MDVLSCLHHHAPEAERNFLGRCLVDKTSYLEYWPKLSPEMFYKYRDVFEYLNKMHEKYQQLDLASLPDSPDQLPEIMDFSGILPTEKYFIEIYTAYQIRTIAKIILMSDKTELRDMVDAINKELDYTSEFPDMKMKEGIQSCIDQLSGKKADRKTYHIGIPKIDDYLKVMAGHIVYIVAPPKTGKTWIECAIASHLSIGNSVYYVSCEMHPRDLFMRIASMVSKTDLTDLIFKKNPDPSILPKFNNALPSLLEKRLTICNARGINFNQLKSKIITAIYGHYDIILVDYLQRISTSIDDLRVATLTMSRELTNLAAKHDKLFIVATQAGRAARQAEHTQAFHAKESSAIEEDADVVLSLTNKTKFEKHKFGEPYQMTIDVFQRNGWAGLVDLFFDPTTGRFAEHAEDFNTTEKELFYAE